MSVFSHIPSKIALKSRIVTVFGGTGFIGTRIIQELLAAGAIVRVATRHPQSAYFLRPAGEVGQVVPVFSSCRSAAEIDHVVEGSDMVVNCMGILYEKSKNAFSHVHTDLPAWISMACAKRGIRFVHLSALAVDRARSEYAISKLSGDNAVLHYHPVSTILRPSVVFGAGDSFTNRFARLARILPVLPLFGGGKSRFQPVYVGDVARAVVLALSDPSTQGRIYEIGGPEVMTFAELYKKIFTHSGQEVCTVSIPWWIARVQAFFMGMLPCPPITNDQLTSLQTDNIVQDGALSLRDLGITPVMMEAVCSGWLGRYGYKGRKG